ncbi:MAG: BLUF domain-containing protein [Anaerolineae bacterium]|nr:BLUF domain-containing protein [Anaerolineae bacterium]MDW8171926.1 BLUF domain-containing protein [Anaerolineae bacterium]
MALVSLIYVSMAVRPMTDDDLRDILRKAREKNARLNITGMLLYRDGFFLQILEGEQAQVDELFAVIVADERHKNVLKVEEHPITERTFGQWTMGFNPMDDLSDEDMAGFTDYLERQDVSYFDNHPDRMYHLLERFKDRTFF